MNSDAVEKLDVYISFGSSSVRGYDVGPPFNT